MAAQPDELSTVDDCKMVASENSVERALMPTNERKRKRSLSTDHGQDDNTKKPKLMKTECASKATDSNAETDLLSSNKRKRKRSQDSDDGTDCTNKSKVVKIKRATKITDLNVDCFGHIFDYLKLRNLLNVADLNENATEAAKLIFIRRYANYDVVLCGHKRSQSIEIDNKALKIIISTPTQCARMLFIFGDVIEKLKLLNFDRLILADRLWNEVRHLINEKCTKHVTTLKLTKCAREMMADMENIFKCVDTLEITCSRLDEKFMDLGKWFPQLHKLELLHHGNCGQIVCNYPHLSYLTMDTTHDECLSTAQFKAMLKTVPKLQILSLSGGMKSSLLVFVAENLLELKKLYLEDFHIENQTDAMISFNNVETLSVSSGLLGDLPTKIPFKMDKLTDLRVKTELLRNEWIDYAIQKSHLTKLQLISICESNITDIKLNALAAALTELIELDITANISTDGLKRILAECKSLQTMLVKMYGRSGEHLKLASVDNKWTAKQIGGGVAFQRS